MLDDIPSLTALGTAVARAVHRHVDEAPAVFDDPYAERLLPAYQRRYIRSLGTLSGLWRRYYRRQTDAFTALRAQVVVRSRYTEDALAAAAADGARRCVVLAAGLDTLALRRPVPGVEVLEIDHPATQRRKRSLLAERGLEVAGDVTFLPVDFEAVRLEDVWPLRADPDFVSWLGTTYYLSGDAVAGTLRSLAGLTAPGSRIVLDYWRERPPTVAGNLLLWGTRLAVALQSEPMLSFFEPDEIAELAAATGWTVRENLTPDAQNQRYLAGRGDGLRVPSFAHLLELAR